MKHRKNFINEDYKKQYKYIDSNDNITYLGKGFKYVDGGYYIHDISATFSETYLRKFNKSELNSGSITAIVVTKEEFENELSNMIDFIKENGKIK